jgi:hypothetical protein
MMFNRDYAIRWVYFTTVREARLMATNLINAIKTETRLLLGTPMVGWLAVTMVSSLLLGAAIALAVTV